MISRTPPPWLLVCSVLSCALPARNPADAPHDGRQPHHHQAQQTGPRMQYPLRPELIHVQPYPPAQPVEEVQREHGLTEVVKLASNENPYGPSPKAIEAISAELPSLHLYPESGCYYLGKTLAVHLGVPEETLLFGNGSDEV